MRTNVRSPCGSANRAAWQKELIPLPLVLSEVVPSDQRAGLPSDRRPSVSSSIDRWTAGPSGAGSASFATGCTRTNAPATSVRATAATLPVARNSRRRRSPDRRRSPGTGWAAARAVVSSSRSRTVIWLSGRFRVVRS